MAAPHPASSALVEFGAVGLGDPAAAAWLAAGRPVVDVAAETKGRCGRCGSTALTVPSSQIVSEKFASFDGWPYGLDRLCLACAWAYHRAPNAQPALHITASTLTEHTDSTELRDVLCAGALPAGHAVIVPATRRQHILPSAQWGHLATDGFQVRWDAAAAQRLTELAWIRGLLAVTKPGAGTWTPLGAPTPPTWLLRAQPAQQWPRLLECWQQLQQLRSLPLIWAAARRLTNPPATAAGPRETATAPIL